MLVSTASSISTGSPLAAYLRGPVDYVLSVVLGTAGSSSIETGQGDMVAVQVETDPTFSLGAATRLFPEGEYRADVNHRQYDVTPDDQRFIMLRPTGEDEESEWILVLNFFEELRTAAPVP